MYRLALLILVVACGGSKQPTTPRVALEPKVDELRWYRASTPCGQGPYVFEVDATGAKYGEDVELLVATPRKVAFEARTTITGDAPRTASGVYDGTGIASGMPDNARCVADAKERLAIARGTGSGDPGVPGGTTVITGEPPPPPTTTTAELVLETESFEASATIVHLRVPRAGRVRFELWSIAPNDLIDVRFGVGRIVWRPNVSEAAYELYLTAEQERYEAEARRAPVVVATRPQPKPVVVDTREADRRRQIAAALEEDRREKRRRFCEAHHDDRDCWGAGGYRMHAHLEQKKLERAAYCAKAPEDARCWTDEEWRKRRIAWDERASTARTESRPDGPPPGPKDDPQSPKPSTNATWRPGYWHWVEGQWVWLAGMWRVPEEDIAAEQTATAPSAPPAQPEPEPPPPPPPVTTAVWIPGSWQWDGARWIWIAGAYQLRPATTVEWRAPEWRPRGSIFIFVPGGWVRR